MYKTALCIVLLASPLVAFSQVILEADGPGNTYELICSVLAPGNDAVENPECIHPAFGRHIAEIWDADLNQYVFEFYSHVTPDNDRCINLDRQRIEIKTYEPSPDNLKGIVGETITYKWKFKLPVGFQPSSSFTHIHQIKAVGGNDGDPLFTLTPRKGSPNKLELIHDNTTKIATVNLSLFEGVWVQCTEVIKVGSAGTYSIVIKKVADGTTILSYSSSGIMTIRSDNNFIRPKWGIYRSLDHPSDLRDEAVRFAGFSIQEGATGVKRSEAAAPEKIFLQQNYPNPFNPSTIISYQISAPAHIQLAIYDCLGRVVDVLVDRAQSAGYFQTTWDASRHPGGVYLCRLHIGDYMASRKILLLK
ncbi:MAG: T9SS type A sorting domain-containing protein [Ignavibacteriales bacterium]|nr:T9SS type A sorting domain-containing protein [Ignavibacteriales bacterium]